MSASLVKLIDTALIPAAVMVVSKLVGVFLFISILQVQWSIKDYTTSIFATQTAVSFERLAEVSSYSDIFLLAVMSAFVGLQLYRSIYLKQHRIAPQLLAKLSQRNLLNLVSGSFDIFYTGAIWAVFSWATTLTIMLNVLQGKSYGWIGLMSVIISLIFTVFLLRDVYEEIEHNRKQLGKQFAF